MPLAEKLTFERGKKSPSIGLDSEECWNEKS